MAAKHYIDIIVMYFINKNEDTQSNKKKPRKRSKN